MTTPALLLHSEPSDVLDVLRSCSGLDWDVATAPDEVAPALARHDPRVVLSIKHSGFPGPAHAAALQHPGLAWFHVGGSGRDHLGPVPDGVRVTDSAGVLSRFLAERALAALLHLSTRQDEAVRDQAQRRWHPTRFRSLQGRTVLIVGAGHVGTAFARVLAPLGAHLVGVRSRGAEPHAPFHEMHGPGALDDLLPRADVVSLHVRATRATEHLLDARRLALLPKGALVLNSARGAVLDEAALERALWKNVAGAWLDVFAEEPLPRESLLWSAPRVLVTPHHADQTSDFPRHFAERFRALWNDVDLRRHVDAAVG